ncbi:class I SAM-dependent methyltransferase [Bradyrhizobium prioriisuperbiae]|uniref:class I SAM-dependent methyltransferase n=1 Tax=Bradyrhizobium prioriisuperbiae TaxID=2854389 RepID=UPI0028EA5667|nr:class I SAM-dependent methyltransferase [Bradyrhizobium prioritasuperba]
MSTTTSAIHHSASDGFAAKADEYARGRPDYPADVLNWLQQRLGLGTGKTVVDLGAGTGKFTAYLAKTGAHVIAVEPVTQMREKLSHTLPEVEALSGTAEAIPLPDASVDAVTCAQAFHWFATSAALTEIHRVLKPGGKLGLIWNVRDESVAWIAKLTRIINQHEGDAPRYASGAWKKVFPHAGFGPLHEDIFPHGHTGTPEDVIINRVRSTSFIAALPADQEANVVAQLRDLIASEPTLAGKPELTVPYTTSAFSAEKLGA